MKTYSQSLLFVNFENTFVVKWKQKLTRIRWNWSKYSPDIIAGSFILKQVPTKVPMFVILYPCKIKPKKKKYHFSNFYLGWCDCAKIFCSSSCSSMDEAAVSTVSPPAANTAAPSPPSTTWIWGLGLGWAGCCWGGIRLLVLLVLKKNHPYML